MSCGEQPDLQSVRVGFEAFRPLLPEVAHGDRDCACRIGQFGPAWGLCRRPFDTLEPARLVVDLEQTGARPSLPGRRATERKARQIPWRNFGGGRGG